MPRPFELNQDLIAIIDPKGLIDFATPGLLELFGLEWNTPFDSIKPTFLSAAEKKRIIRAFEQALATPGHDLELDVILKDKDASTLHIRLKSEPGKKGKNGKTLLIAHSQRNASTATSSDDLEHLSYISKLINFTEDPVFSTDPDFVIRSWNKAAENLYGFPAEQVMGRSMPEVFPDMEFLGATVEHTIGIMKQEGHWTGECKFHTASGAWKYVSASVNRIYAPDGRDIGFVSIHKDITSKRQAEERMRFLSSLMDNTSDGIFTTDLDHRITSWNRGCVAKFGVTEAEALNKTFREVVQSLDYQGSSHLKMLGSLLKDGHWQGECRIKSKAGNIIEASVSVNTVYGTAMQPIGYVSIHRDITRSKQAEENFRQLSEFISQSQDIVLSTDSDFRILTWNKAAEQLYGIPAGQAVGKIYAEAIGDRQFPERYDRKIRDTLKRKTSWNGEITIHGPEGRTLYLHSDINKLVDESGRSTGYLIHQRDLNRSDVDRSHLLSMADLMDQSSEAFLSTGLDFRIRAWNKGAEELFGISEGDALGKELFQILGRITPEHQTMEDAIGELVDKGKWNGLVHMLTPTGKESYVLAHVNSVTNASGERIGYMSVYHDITGTKKQEFQDRYLNRMLQFTNDAIIALDPEFKVVSFNKGAEKLYGIPDKNAKGRFLKDIIGDAEFPDWKKGEFARLLEEKEHWNGEFLQKLPGGGKRAIQATVSQVRDGADALVGYMTIHHLATITEQEHFRRNFLHTLMEVSEDAIYVSGIDQTLIAWNKACEKLYEVPAEKAIGRRMKDLIRSITPVDMPLSEALAELTTKKKWAGECIIVTKSGKELRIHNNVSAIYDERGEHYGFVALHRDITDMLRSERAKASRAVLLDQTTDAVVATDMDMLITNWNKGAETMYGVPEKNAIGKRLAAVAGPFEFPCASVEEAAQILRAQGEWVGDMIVHHKSGKDIMVNLKSSILRDKDGQPIGFLGIHRDISAEWKANQRDRYLSYLLSQTSDAVFTMDLGFKVTTWNHGAENLYEKTPEEVIGRDIKDVLDRATYPDMNSGAIRATVKENGQWLGELLWTTTSGKVMYIKTSVTQVLDQKGVCIGYLGVHHNATSLREKEQDIRHLARITEFTDDAVFSTDREFQCLSWNYGAERMYGLKFEDVRGMSLAEILPKREYTGYTNEEATRELLEKGQFKGEAKVALPDGRTFWIQSSVNRMMDEQGKHIGYVTIHRDITESKKASEAQEYMANMMAHTQQAIIMLDAGYHILSWNQGARSLYGFQEREVLGREFRDVIHRAQFLGTTTDEIRKEMNEKGGWKGHIEYPTADGKLLLIEAHVSRVNARDGSLLGFVAIHRDITEEKENAEKVKLLNRLLQNTNEALISLDKDYRVVGWNHGAAKIYGLPEKEVFGLTIGEILPGASYPDSDPIAVRNAVAKNGSWEGEIQVVRDSGKKMRIKATASRVDDEQGNLLGYLAIHRDITNEKKIAEQNEYLNRLLQYTDEAVISLDQQFRVIGWNHGATVIYGKGEKDVLDQTLSQALPEAQYPDAGPMEIRQALVNEGRWEGNMTYPGAGGDLMHFRINASRVEDADGKFIGYVAIHHDDTATHSARERMHYLSNLVEQSTDVIFSTGLDFRIRSWNRSAMDMYGMTEGEAIGKTFAEVVGSITYLDQSRESVLSALDKEGKWTGKLHLRFGADREVYILVNMSLLMDAQGAPQGYLVNHRDITALKEAESRNDHLTRMLHYTKDGIVSVDTDFKIRFWNKAAEKLLGKTEQEALGLTMHELMGEAKLNDETLVKMRKDLLSNGYVEGDFHVDDFDGKPMHLHLDIRQVTADDGTNLGFIAMYRDITRVWQKEQESILSRQMLETVFNSTLEGMSIMDPEGIVLRINDKGLELSGTTREQRVGKPLWTNTFWEKDPEELERLQLALEDARQGKITSYTLKFDLGDGTHRHVAISIKPTLDENGKTIYISSEAKDISGQAQAEEQLQYNAELLNSFQENTPLPSWLMNEKDEIIYMNPVFRELFGLRQEDTGRKMKDLLPSRFMRQYQTHNDIVRNTGNSLQTLEHAVDTEGILHTFLVTRFPIRILGKPLLIGGKGVDITELLKAQEEVKESNKRFESVGEATNDLIWELDLSTMTIGEFGNSEILWGSRKNFSHTFDEFLEVIDPKDRDALLKSFEKTLQNRFKDKWHGEFRVNHPDGSVRHVLDRAIILRTPDGHPFKVVGTIQDITDRVRLEKELIEQHNEEHKRTTRKIFEAEEKERTRIAGDLHDNVNPLLAAAKMHISIAESHMEDPTPYLLQSKALIYEGIEEIRKISRNLSTNFIKEMSVEEAVDSTVQKLNPGEDLQIHTIYRRLERLHLDPPFKMNIIRIVQEQVHNTLKYAAAKNLYIEVSYREGKLRMVIKDDGKGFDTRQTRPGVGLTNIRSRVESYSGQMKITSAPGKGTKMEIDIPVKEA